MIGGFVRLVASISLYSCIGFCVAATVLLLVLLNWSSEQTAWVHLSAAGMPTWAIVLGIALAWLRNSVFWSCVLIAGVGSAWIWHWARKNQENYAHAGVKLNRELKATKTTKATRRKGRHLWYFFLSMLPVLGASNGANQYGYVDGVYQKLPFSLENVLIGFFAGVVLSGIFYAIGLGLTRLLKIIRSRTSGEGLRK